MQYTQRDIQKTSDKTPSASPCSVVRSGPSFTTGCVDEIALNLLKDVLITQKCLNMSDVVWRRLHDSYDKMVWLPLLYYGSLKNSVNRNYGLVKSPEWWHFSRILSKIIKRRNEQNIFSIFLASAERKGWWKVLFSIWSASRRLCQESMILTEIPLTVLDQSIHHNQSPLHYSPENLSIA